MGGPRHQHEEEAMKLPVIATVVAAACAGCAILAIDNGIFVGSDFVLQDGYAQKTCEYLYVTGVSRVEARNGRVSFSDITAERKFKLQLAGFSDEEIATYLKEEGQAVILDALTHGTKADQGFCRLFGSGMS